MSLQNFLQAFDRELAFTYKVAVAASAYSTGVIDLGADGKGLAASIHGIIIITAVSGTNPTLDVTVCSENADETPEDVILTMPQITAVGRYHFTLPQDVKRYVRLNYTIGGTDTPTFTIWSYLTMAV